MKTDSPTHAAIAQRAQEIWATEGRPTGRDNQIWLTAEQQLSTPATSVAARLKSETAAESVVEFHLPSSTPEEVAVRAALQTPESGGLKSPGKTAPQLAATAEVRGAGTSQSTTSPATNPAPATPASRPAGTSRQAQQQKNAARDPLIAR